MSDERRVLFLQHQDDCGPGHLGDRARERGLDVEIVDLARGERPGDPGRYALVVSLGSDDSTLDDAVAYLADERAFVERAVEQGVPVLGVCFGAQLLATVLGAGVRPLEQPEIGWLPVTTRDPDLVPPGPWLVWHLDAFACPPDADLLAWTDAAVQAYRHGRHVGVQFHPEATRDSAAAWAAKYEGALASVGIDRAALLAETEQRSAQARARAAALFDRMIGADARAAGVSP